MPEAVLHPGVPSQGNSLRLQNLLQARGLMAVYRLDERAVTIDTARPGLGLAPPNPEVDKTCSGLRGKILDLSPTC